MGELAVVLLLFVIQTDDVSSLVGLGHGWLGGGSRVLPVCSVVYITVIQGQNMGSRGWNNVDPQKPNMTGYFRTASCAGEPQTNALRCMKSSDLHTFTDIVNVPDVEGRDSYPFPKDHWINQPLEEEDGKTLLLVAISDQLHHYMEVLLKVGAIADLYNEDLGQYPIHLAAQRGDVHAVQLLLDAHDIHPNNVADVNCINKVGRTALHLAAEKGHSTVVEKLCEAKGVDVDVKDKKGSQTPLYLAVKNKCVESTKILMENGADLNAICLGRPISNLLAEKLPLFNVSLINVKKPNIDNKSSVLHLLGTLIDANALSKTTYTQDLQQFNSLLSQTNVETLKTFKSFGLTLLQKCCSGGLHEFANALLNKGVDPNYCQPILLAAYRGFTEVLKVMHKHHADFTVEKKGTNETLLHRLLIKDEEFDPKQFQECLQFLLSQDDDDLKLQIDKIINKKDILDNTALHYATQRWNQATVRSLLERGSNIGIKNKWGEIPINKILPTTMEDFLDQHCLQSTKDINHEEFELTFRYSFLAPPIENLPAEVQGSYVEDEEKQNLMSNKNFALPETESLWYMAQNKGHRHLLRHPVIASFLWCKWNRIRRYINRNLRLYTLFVVLITWYIFEEFGGLSLRSEDGSVPCMYAVFVVVAVLLFLFIMQDWTLDLKELMRTERMHSQSGSNDASSVKSCLHLFLGNWLEVLLLGVLTFLLWAGSSHSGTVALANANQESMIVAVSNEKQETNFRTLVLPIMLTLGVVIMAFRELFQLMVSLRRYILDPENWIEATMMILIILIIYLPDDGNNDLKRNLAGITLLLSWSELITLVAKHPNLTRYNVYVTMFYKVLKTFFFFLIWYIFFIIAFAMALYIMLHKDNGKPSTEKDPYVFFDTPWLSLVKTCTMFVGELEFSDIPVDLESPLSPVTYAFFLVFVFLIVVVLMNLLNGLAVSDTGKIQEKAEIVSYVSRVETISYAESLLLGDPFNFLSNWPTLKWIVNLPSVSFCRKIYANKTTRQVFQRLTGATGILLFYNHLPDKQLVVKPNERSGHCGFGGDGLVLDGEIVEAAKAVVLKKQKGEEEDGGKVEEARTGREKLIEDVAANQEKIVMKMEMLERKLDAILSRMKY